MNTNNHNSKQASVPDEIIALGVASVETKGAVGFSEGISPGGPMVPGISEE